MFCGTVSFQCFMFVCFRVLIDFAACGWDLFRECLFTLHLMLCLGVLVRVCLSVGVVYWIVVEHLCLLILGFGF